MRGFFIVRGGLFEQDYLIRSGKFLLLLLSWG